MEHRNLNQEPGDDLSRISKPEPTDAQKLIRQHITDPDHEITDDDIRNVRITPATEVPAIGAEAMARLEDISDEEISDDGRKEADDAQIEEITHDNNEDDESKKVTTPWDTVSE